MRDQRDFLIWNCYSVPYTFWYIIWYKNTSQYQCNIYHMNQLQNIYELMILTSRHLSVLCFERRPLIVSINITYLEADYINKERDSNALATLMHTESAAIFLLTEKAVGNYKWEIWQIIISFSAAVSLLWSLWSNVPHDFSIWLQHWHSPMKTVSILPFHCSSLPLILPGTHLTLTTLCGLLSDLTDQCLSPPVAFWGDSYQLCSYVHLTTLLADSDSASEHLHGAQTLPQTTPLFVVDLEQIILWTLQLLYSIIGLKWREISHYVQAGG